MGVIVVEFEVSTSPDHAFEVWTSKPSMWWPRSLTVTQDPRVSIIFEPYEAGAFTNEAPMGRSTIGARSFYGSHRLGSSIYGIFSSIAARQLRSQSPFGR